MKDVKLYTRALCSWCIEAKNYLHAHDIPFEEIDVGKDPATNEEMQRVSGQNYVPTLVVDGHVLADLDVAKLEQFLATLPKDRPPSPTS
ncbi:MAG: glutaredoxin domain-containing protein [Verrucomicrobiia bacterium]